MFRRIARVVERRQILWTLVQRDLRVRYSRSALGYLWTVLDPLLMASVYFVVFTYIFDASGRKVGDSPYFLFLLTGLLAWQWFNSSMNDTARSLIQEARLVRSTSLPRELWVVRVVFAKGIEFLLSLPILIAFAAYYVFAGKASLDWELVLFPLGILLQTVLLIGIGLILAPITVLVTDTQRVVRIFLRLFFYLTPILYGQHAVPDVMRPFLALNPLNGILELYRGGFFERSVHWGSVGISVLVTLALCALGGLVFSRLERSVLKEI